MTNQTELTAEQVERAIDRLESMSHCGYGPMRDTCATALTARAEQAERERDAAVADLDTLKDSGFCNSCVGCNAPHSESITYCTDWTRRGLPQAGEESR